MSAPTPDQIGAYARALEAGASLLDRLLAALRGGPQAQAARKRRAAMRKLRRASRAEAKGDVARGAALRREAHALLAEAEVLWPLGEELAALEGGGT